ncbi:MAG: acetyl-CoA carboxylase biotin carboxyl carrier protein, partial [Quisquiliibacterium sp.]
MDLRKLKTLIDLVSESDICELEITEGDGKVRIVKGAAAAGLPSQTPSRAVFTASTPAPASEAAVAADTTELGAQSAIEIAGHLVKSPMVGTFYRSAQPGAEP